MMYFYSEIKSVACIAIAMFMLTACVNLDPQLRWAHADNLADKAGWQKQEIHTGKFLLRAYVPITLRQADTLAVYFEGDGLSWLGRTQVSLDPTPQNPIALKMAFQHPAGNAVYLARPCQYIGVTVDKSCTREFWTNKRFSVDVVASASQAVSELKQRYSANKLVLIGYSGGGAIAALVAARRSDVVKLVTVAGNLDHRVWTTMHHDTPLEGSLNPADEWQGLSVIPQKHYIGELDEVVGRAVAEAYISRFPADNKPELLVVPGFGHACCWAEQWLSVGFK